MGCSYTYDSDAPQRRESVLPYRALGEAPLAASPPSWGYAYNLRGEVTGAVRGDADGAAVAGQDWGYFYDAIGNRSSSTRAGRAVIYEPNALNQYEMLQHPGEVEVSGLTAPGVARVEVNGEPAAGRPAGNGEPEGFTQWLTVANSAKAVWLDVGVKATRPGEPPENTPLEMLRQGRLWVPKAQTAPEHDADGNLLFDGRWRYAWDGENRLVSMETDSEVGLLPNAPPRLRLEFVYDGGSRRVGKVVKRWQTGAEQWVTIASWKYLYEGWNLIAELDGLRGDALERGYVWGLDLSGTFQGAGGVGGLLGVYDGRRGKVYPVMTEVNGNVMGLADAASGQWVARYDYDAFGNRITAAGPLAGLCPVGFSTKYTDAETGLCYYGYRYYDAVRGRWINRDPIEELGFTFMVDPPNNILNVAELEAGKGTREGAYTMLNNNVVGQVDKLGLTLFDLVSKSYTGKLPKMWAVDLSASFVIGTGVAAGRFYAFFGESCEIAEYEIITAMAETYADQDRSRVEKGAFHLPWGLDVSSSVNITIGTYTGRGPANAASFEGLSVGGNVGLAVVAEGGVAFSVSEDTKWVTVSYGLGISATSLEAKTNPVVARLLGVRKAETDAEQQLCKCLILSAP